MYNTGLPYAIKWGGYILLRLLVAICGYILLAIKSQFDVWKLHGYRQQLILDLTFALIYIYVILVLK